MHPFEPIGYIQSPHKEKAGMPIQPSGARGIRATATIGEPWRAGLKDLEGFSHVYLIYLFHEAGESNLEVTPFLDTEPHGVFATRAPSRPNPIGLSVVKLLGVEEGVLYLENVDVLDGTPLLDIKPYVPAFDAQGAVRTGWMEKTRRNAETQRSDGRFS